MEPQFDRTKEAFKSIGTGVQGRLTDVGNATKVVGRGLVEGGKALVDTSTLPINTGIAAVNAIGEGFGAQNNLLQYVPGFGTFDAAPEAAPPAAVSPAQLAIASQPQSPAPKAQPQPPTPKAEPDNRYALPEFPAAAWESRVRNSSSALPAHVAPVPIGPAGHAISQHAAPAEEGSRVHIVGGDGGSGWGALLSAGIKGKIERQAAERADRRNEVYSRDALTAAGHAIQSQGQYINAATSAMGHAIQQRGQDVGYLSDQQKLEYQQRMDESPAKKELLKAQTEHYGALTDASRYGQVDAKQLYMANAIRNNPNATAKERAEAETLITESRNRELEQKLALQRARIGY